MSSPFLEIPPRSWVAANDLAFAVRDRYPVSPGHTLVIPRRLVPTWFEASRLEQQAILALIDEVKVQLDAELHPDGYNVGFNAGEAAGQTVMHLHVHVIPRYRDDMDDPRGGVRHVIPSKGNYLRDAAPLATGGEDDPFDQHVFRHLERAQSASIVAAFIRLSGLVRLQARVLAALGRGARLRILTGDYLGITEAKALEMLLDWQASAESSEDDGEGGRLEARIVEVESLPTKGGSFHPKSWRFEGPRFGVAFVGSSNISNAALGAGVEWNLRVDRDRDADAFQRICEAFESLWTRAQPLTPAWVEDYARRVREHATSLARGEVEVDEPITLPSPHAVQVEGLLRLRDARAEGRMRALAVYATGLGKTLLAVLDYAQLWESSGKAEPPRLLFLAHRQELLAQAAGAFRTLLRERDTKASVGWCAETRSEIGARLVFASVAKLARTTQRETLRDQSFDYVVIDEVHHAAAHSYRRILDALDARFLLGLTATPERADGADILGLFDDHVVHRASIGAGIELGRLVPFRYFGIKDAIDYAPTNLPWRNRRFDPERLAAAAQTEARMLSLWEAWQRHPGRRTLIFCCSVVHANYVRDWLNGHGVKADAVHSGPGANDRMTALQRLRSGEIQAVCAVDVFNEGVDVPEIDRVVMLRPTESNVVFLQQLGRGLRAHADKEHLTVIDFVGNHRVFLDRLRALFSLGEATEGGDLRRMIEDSRLAELPAGCSVEIELEAKELLSRLFRSDGADRVERAYRELAVAREDRPRAGELLRMGYAPGVLRQRHRSWFEFVRSEGDLTEIEQAVLEHASPLLRDLETTPMTRSFKMITLQALIEHEAVNTGMALDELASRSHAVLRRDPSLLRDVPERLREPTLTETLVAEWRDYWRKNPIAAWTRQTKRGRPWFMLDGDRLTPTWSIPKELAPTLAEMIAELVDLRLAQYRRRGTTEGGSSFTCKVTWNQRDPILKLPSRERHTIPEGELDVRLGDGTVWSVRLAKEFCNVARPAGARRNGLPDLLRGWFGPSAGHPGTAYRVRFEAGPDGWIMGPDEPGAEVLTFPRRAIAAYPDLAAAAGHVAQATVAAEKDAVELPIQSKDVGELFAVRVAGDSMDGGPEPLRRGDWAVFRLGRGLPASAFEGRVALVQKPTGDGNGYQIKRLRRRGRGWALSSDNPSFTEQPADASMIVIARLERAIRPESLAPERGAVLRSEELSAAFGVAQVEARTGRFGGHLFLFGQEKDWLVSPNHVRREVTTRPGETAYVLGRVGEDTWRYLGVGRIEEDGARWRIPEVDAEIWNALGAGGVSRPIPPGVQERALEVVAQLVALPEAERWIEQANGARARVLGASKRGGLRIVREGHRERSVSLTDLAWVIAADADVREHGGLLDEARVNKLRYLEGTSKGSTRYIDTGWALAAWERARSLG